MKIEREVQQREMKPNGNRASGTQRHEIKGLWLALFVGILLLTGYASQSQAWATGNSSVAAQGATLPSVIVQKSANKASVNETGENVTFTVNVTNSNGYKIKITDLTDSVFGNLNNVGTCSTPKILNPGQSYSCNFTKFLSGEPAAPHQNKVTAKAQVEPPHALATPAVVTSNPATTVNFKDVMADIEATAVADPASVPEPSGSVDYTVTVVNQKAELLQLTQLTDSILGNLHNVGSCQVPASLGPAGSSTEAYSCTFATTVAGNAGAQVSRQITAKAVDNENTNNTESRTVTVSILGVSSSLMVTKSANPTNVPESGGNVNYTVTIRNSSSADKVTVNTVTDNKFGNIANTCSPSLPRLLNPNESITCSFLRNIAGDFGQSHVSTTSVTAQDDDGEQLAGQASTSVSFTNVASSIGVTKTADRASASRAGEVVTFSIAVKNNSSVDRITLATMSDSAYGNVANSANPLLEETDCELPKTLDPNGTYTCQFSALVTGDIGEEHRNQITVTGEDDDQATVQASGEAVVLIADPEMSVLKSVELKTDADGDEATSPGDTLHYRLTIANQGNKTASAVIMNDNISEYTTLVNSSVTASQGSFSKGQTAGDRNIVANLGDIGQGETVTVDFDVVILSALPKGITAVSNQASITGQNFPALVSQSPNGGGPTVTRLTLVPDLAAEKTAELLEDLDNNGIVSPGDVVEYTIVVRNRGSAPATDVVLTDTPDPNTTVEQLSEVNGVSQMAQLNSDGAFVLELGSVARGGEVTTRFKVRVNSPLNAGVTQIANQAIITSNELPAISTDDPSTDAEDDATILSLSAAPVLAATQSDTLLLDNDNNGSPSAGDVVLLKVQIVNSGNSQATSVQFRNALPQHTTFVANTINTSQGTVISGASADDNEVVVDIGTLEGNRTSATVSFQLQIVAPLPTDVTEVFSQGRISADGLDDMVTDDPDIPGPGDPTLIQVVARPLVQVAKSDLLFIDADSDGFVTVGDTLLYRINVVNVGNSEATGVTIEDTPDPNTSLVVNSVQSAQGSVPTGNSSGDSSVLVEAGTLPGKGGSIVISFMVTVDNTSNVSQLLNQALVKIDDPNNPGAQFALSSDDPDTAVKADATNTPVKAGAPTIYLPIVTR